MSLGGRAPHRPGAASADARRGSCRRPGGLPSARTGGGAPGVTARHSLPPKLSARDFSLLKVAQRHQEIRRAPYQLRPVRETLRSVETPIHKTTRRSHVLCQTFDHRRKMLREQPDLGIGALHRHSGKLFYNNGRGGGVARPLGGRRNPRAVRHCPRGPASIPRAAGPRRGSGVSPYSCQPRRKPAMAQACPRLQQLSSWTPSKVKWPQDAVLCLVVFEELHRRSHRRG